jgi:hypothetical protein
MPLGGLFYRLLAQGDEVECGLQRVAERHSVEYRPRVEILTQDHSHLPYAGDSPDLGVVVAEQVLRDAQQGLEHQGAVSAKTGKASMRRSASCRTTSGSGLGSSFLKQAPPNSERTCAGSAALPAPRKRRSTSLANHPLAHLYRLGPLAVALQGPYHMHAGAQDTEGHRERDSSTPLRENLRSA